MLLPALGQAQTACERYYSHLSIDEREYATERVYRDIVGDQPSGTVHWSPTPRPDSNLLGPGVKRIGAHNVTAVRNKAGVITGVEVKLAGGKRHSIKFRGPFAYDATRELLAEYISFLPENYVHLLREIRVPTGYRGSLAAFVKPGRKQTIFFVNERNHPGVLLAHEFGHVADHFNLKFFQGAEEQRLIAKWDEAMRLDKKEVSRYGQDLAEEDFAESVARYLEPHEELRQAFRLVYPHRARFLDEYFARTGVPDHGVLQNGLGQKIFWASGAGFAGWMIYKSEGY